MYEKIIPNSHFIISADTENNLNIAPLAGEDTSIDTRGHIWIEVQGKCLAVVRQEGDPDLPGRRLQRLRSIADVEMAGRKHSDGIVIMSRNGRGQLFMSNKSFASVADAKAYLADKYGNWLIVMLEGQRLLPLPEHTDPFSKQIPVPGSLIAGKGHDLSGAFIQPGLYIDFWVLSYYPGGYYVMKIYERCELIDNGMTSMVKDLRVNQDAEQGDYHVFEKYEDNQTRLVTITPTIEEAREAVKDQPGLWLLAKWVDYVDMH